MKLFAIFPGQGSQKIGMGRDLMQTDLAQKRFAEADHALGFSLSSICFEGPAETLTATPIAQPAILTVSTILFELFVTAQGAKHEIVAAAGHSLGEYTALVAAGAINFRDAVRLVHNRGRYMQEAVPVGLGKMVAVLGKEVAEIESALAQVQDGVVQIANINAPGQVVIGGHAKAVDEALTYMPGVKSVALAVSAPFHSSLMKPAEEALARDLATLEVRPAQFAVYSNYSAKALFSPTDIRAALKSQVCGRVRWVECVENAARETGPERVVEFGAGAVLSGMVKRIDPTLARGSVDSAEAAEESF